MAISTKKRNVIRAMWKTGRFSSKNSIAKHYKIDIKTANKIIGDLTKTNADLVRLGVQFETGKSTIKNPVELNAVNKVVLQAVENGLLIQDLTELNLTGLKNKIIDDIEGREVVIIDEEGEPITTIKREMSIYEHKLAQETIDKASITIGVNQRFANTGKVDDDPTTPSANSIEEYEVEIIE